jgi:hypothetical protein
VAARPHTLKGLRIHEISLVDAPANPGAVHLLFKRKDGPAMTEVDPIIKRAFSADERQKLAASGAAMSDGSFPIENEADLKNAIQAVGRASDPAKARAHIKSRARALGATSLIPDDWSGGKGGGTLDRLLTRLGLKKAATPDDIDPATYADDAAKVVDDATDALGKSIASILADEAITDKGAEITKQLAAFRGHVDEHTTALIERAMRDVASVTVTEKDPDMPTLEEVQATNAALTKQLEDAQAELAKARMKPAHAEAYAKMSGDQAKKFLAADDEGREAMLSKSAGGDTQLAKALAETEDLRKRLAVFEEERELATFRKRATEIGLSEAQAETLLKASKGDDKAFDEMLGVIKAQNAQLRTASVFKEFGSSGGMPPAGGQARAEVEAKAEALVKADPKLSMIAARVQVRKGDPALAQRERDEERAAVRAVV